MFGILEVILQIQMLRYVAQALLSGAVNSVFLKQDAMPGFHDFSISNPGLYSSSDGSAVLSLAPRYVLVLVVLVCALSEVASTVLAYEEHFFCPSL